MNALVNKVQLVGRLGADAEMKTFDSGNKNATFRLATTEFYKDSQGERKEETQWHNVVAWGKLAEIIEKYTSKGSEIMLEGKLKYRSYENKEGEKKYFTEVEARELMLMGGPTKTQLEPKSEPKPFVEEVNDGLPF